MTQLIHLTCNSMASSARKQARKGQKIIFFFSSKCDIILANTSGNICAVDTALPVHIVVIVKIIIRAADKLKLQQMNGKSCARFFAQRFFSIVARNHDFRPFSSSTMAKANVDLRRPLFRQPFEDQILADG